MKPVFGIYRGVHRFLHAPQKVIWICLTVLSVSLLLDGSLVRLWALHRDFRHLESDVSKLETQNQELRRKLVGAKDPTFLEREARDRFDLVSEGDLVFVFTEE